MKQAEALKLYHELVEATEDYLEKQEKADAFNTSVYKHGATMAKRHLKTLIKKYRLTNPKQQKAVTVQGGFNFLAK